MVYVTSDLHGYSLEGFVDFLGKVGFCDDDFLYILGDVIDRGKDGVKILKWLMRKRNAQLILGNHEAMMLACDFLFEEITDDYRKLLFYDRIFFIFNKTVAEETKNHPQVALFLCDYLLDPFTFFDKISAKDIFQEVRTLADCVNGNNCKCGVIAQHKCR